MKNIFFIYIYGAIIILEGVFLLFSKNFTFNTTKYALGIGLIIGAILAITTAFTSQRKKVKLVYHEIHALAMFIYGISILLFANNVAIFTEITALFLLFYAFSEIIFCNLLFNLENKVKFNILFIRIFLGLVVGVGTIFSMSYSAIDKAIVMQGYGILFGIIGFNTLIYEPIMTNEGVE